MANEKEKKKKERKRKKEDMEKKSLIASSNVYNLLSKISARTR